MKAHALPAIALIVATMIAGCAQDGTLATSNLNTAAIDPQAESKGASSACLTLASQIESLHREGAADKVSKAAAKTYKLKNTDLTKADELNKANAEFRAKCSNYPPRATVATPSAAPAAAPEAPAPAVAAKSKPPVPAQKPVEAALAPQGTSAPSGQPAAQP